MESCASYEVSHLLKLATLWITTIIFWGVLTVVEGAGAGFVVAVVVEVVVVAVSVVAVDSVAFLLFCPPQAEIKKSTTASNGVERRVEDFIVVDLKIKK